MGILDEAIKEHLDLKRQHGAGASELKKLEDEAFGPADRPGAEETTVSEQLSEAPTEFMSQPTAAEAAATQRASGSEGPEQETRVADEAEADVPERTHSRREPIPGIADLQEAPPIGEPGEEASAMEHTAISLPPTEQEAAAPESEVPAPEPEPPAPEAVAPEPPPSAGPSTEERQAIADQPTEHYDIEQEIASSEPGPSEEELVEEEISEPRLAPIDPSAGLEEVDELEQAAPGERSAIGEEVTSAEPATDEGLAGEDPSELQPADDADQLGQAVGAEAIQAQGEVAPPEEAQGAPEEEEHDDDFFDEKRLSDELDQALEAPAEDEADDSEIGGWHTEEHEAVSGSRRLARKGEDLLDETPDFLEEAPEDDQLWFEQKPPKDFDFDD